jgi:hypothetical protein
LDAVDFYAAEHAGVLARILALAQRPECCSVTRRAMEDILKRTLTKGAVLEAVKDHLAVQRRTYVQIQHCGLRAYILVPCIVGCYELYVKLQLAPKEELMVIVSVHEPEFKPKRKRSNAKRKS